MQSYSTQFIKKAIAGRFVLFFWILLSSCFFSNMLRAEHIVGGEITYQCLGNGQYRFTMKVYRDCSAFGAEFDAVAPVTIYRTDNLFSPYLELDLTHSPKTQIDPVLSPCLELPPGVCVEEAIYVSGIINLPVSNTESYFITYQRCCRNVTIANIFAPEETGATFFTELTPEAQQVCNNSPVFNDFPPIVICANQPLAFDHSASDPEGDELTYYFCSPKKGGGTLGSNMNPSTNPGDATSFVGVAPDPAAPPPYEDVDFIIPNYSAGNPMGGNPQVSIDPNTGLITGTPNITGQFVVGVCVEERRNGELLSITRRDFQFNVTICEPTVRAQIQSDQIIAGDEFVINSCGNQTIDFVNESIQVANIFEYYWYFDLGNGTELEYDTRDVTVTFPDTGTFQGILMVNPGTICGDTADIFVNIFPEVFAQYTFEYDTCEVAPISFTDFSFSEAGPGTITNWSWDFNDGSSSDEQNPAHQFNFPGFRDVQLEVTDINNCADDTTVTMGWYPAPEELIIAPSQFFGCEPLTIFFDNLSFPIDSTYDINWDFGDGGSSSEVSPSYIYEDPGTFSVSLDVTSPFGCMVSTFYEDWINVQPSPIAGFDYNPKKVTNFNPTVDFTDESEKASFWQWIFDDDGFAAEPNPTFTFPDTGVQVVTQIVTHESGCQDTATARIDIVPEIRYFLPNAFTPNTDGSNDLFLPVGFFEGIRNYQMTIWNRWGELIFETTNPSEGWNGKKNNSGELAPVGVYVYYVRFTGPRGEDFEYKGYATLIR